MSRQMSATEYNARKHAQTRATQATSALGLAGLGALTLASKRGAGAAEKLAPRLRKVPGFSTVRSPKHLQARARNAAAGTAVVSGGIGSLAGFNGAALNDQNRVKARVRKSYDYPDTPVFGEVSKAWSPNASKFDPEGQRMKRTDAYPKMLTAASGGLLVAAGHQAAKAKRPATMARAAKSTADALPNKYRNNRPTKAKVRLTNQAAEWEGAARRLKVRSGKLAAAGAVAAGAAAATKRKRDKGAWSPYISKSASAFGVDHR